MKCEICYRECKSFLSLARHITQTHKYKSKQYYDEFISTISPKCEVCGSDTVSFVSLGSGYTSTCSHKCGGILHRANLRKDSARHEEFASKVAKNQQQIWRERSFEGTDITIRNKIGNTRSNLIKKLTDEERIEKFGWMKKLSPDKLQSWKEEKMLTSGAHAWWRTASENEKSLVYRKRNASRAGLSLEAYDNVTREPIQLYYSLVGFYTETSYRTYIDIIDPNKLRGPDFHLDHKYSVLRGFYDSVPPEVIGSYLNLEILPATENVRKSAKCSIKLETLLEAYSAQL